MAAGLNPTNADACATAICSALGVSDATSQALYKTIYETLYAHLKSDIQCIIAAGAITTLGGPTTQTGPAAPVPLVPT